MSAAAPQERRYAGSAAVTATLQIAAMLIGGLLAVLISHLFGKGADTDGLFAAYGVYGLLLALAQTLRTTIVPRLAEGDLWAELDRLLGAALLITLAFGLPLVLLREPLAAAMTGSLDQAAQDAAATALAVLWVAAVAQFAAATAAGALAVRSEFALPGLAYAGGGLVGLGLVIVLDGPLGTDAVPVGVAIGSLLTAALLLGRLVALGWRPVLARVLPGADAARRAGMMLLGAVSALVGQLSYLVTLGFAARLGEGAVTLYSYAFFASALLIGATAIPAGIVMAAPLTQDWDRRPASLRTDVVAVSRFGFMLLLPVPAAALAFGPDLVLALLGDAVTRADANTVVAAFVILSLAAAATVAAAVPLLAAFAESRYGAVAIAALAAAVLHTALTAVAGALADTLQALALAASLSAVGWVAILFHMVLRSHGGELLAAVGREAAIACAGAIVAFGPPLALALGIADGTWALGLGCWLAGLALYALLIRSSPRHRELAGRVSGPLLARLRGIPDSGPLSSAPS